MLAKQPLKSVARSTRSPAIVFSRKRVILDSRKTESHKNPKVPSVNGTFVGGNLRATRAALVAGTVRTLKAIVSNKVDRLLVTESTPASNRSESR